jgi:uncharacterized protein (DUF2267 family)
MVETHRAEQRPERPEQDARNERPVDLPGDVALRVRLPPGVTPEAAIEAVLCVLSQHAFGGEARHVLNALPKDIRPVLQRCAQHQAEPTSRFDRNELLRRIGEHLKVSPGDAEDIASAVLMAIGARLKPEDVHAIADQLPLELRDLWAVRRAAPPVDPHPILQRIEHDVTLPYAVTGVGAFATVMGTLSRRLTKSVARLLLESVPVELRPLMQPFVDDRDEMAEPFDKPHLLSRVAVLLGMDDPEPVVRVVFVATQEYLRTDVFERVMNELPGDLQDLWVLPTLP